MHKGTIVCSITFENWLVRNSNIIVVLDIEVTPGKKVCDSDKYAMRIRRSIFCVFSCTQFLFRQCFLHHQLHITRKLWKMLEWTKSVFKHTPFVYFHAHFCDNIIFHLILLMEQSSLCSQISLISTFKTKNQVAWSFVELCYDKI